MDEGPFRMSRPTDRRPVVRPEPTQRQPEAPQPVREQPKVAPQVTVPRVAPREKRSSKRPNFLIAIIIVVIILAAGFCVWLGLRGSGSTGIDGSKYQAVFFTNGQVYFGKLQAFNNAYMKLTDIYYLQSQNSTTSGTNSENPQTTSNKQNNVQLIKLGDEIHGPEDEMVIAKDQMLFFENLKPSGKVAQSIAKFNKN